MNPYKIYLAQTDTTVGFLSRDRERLASIKSRPPDKPFLIEVDSLASLRDFVRVPREMRRRMRRQRKTTFIYPNGKALRLVERDNPHWDFIRRFGWLYSTSANRSGERFDREFARSVADIIVEDRRGLFEGEPSRLVRLGKRKMRYLR
ncbi:MAG: Sua5/YciO/YrdC/YwlC family protein [Epsilonproteobacteria bacterium]|nr:Sua5 YciO YrdC YwlC family protein [Campylobacterota bacterium]NPA56342.1 Sua5/YciO/YrdC/YwlC family protein [Campylobacterota bacterium]